MARTLFFLEAALLLLAGCGWGGGGGTVPPEWSEVDDFAYQLQGIDPAELGRSAFDLLVIEPTAEGDEASSWTAAELAVIREGPGGPKRLLAYLSIGEAEDYRDYWNPAWNADGDTHPDPGAPSWLADENPDWPGNYRVRFWDPDWQALVLARVDDLVARGYDGVWLDIVDAFEWWGPGGGSSAERSSALADMVAFVAAIGDRDRVENGAPDFAVFPQNGEALIDEPGYLDLIDGIGREDLWTDGDLPTDPGEAALAIARLEAAKAAGKLVLVIDYPTAARAVDALYAKAAAQGFLAYAPPRDLDRLVVNPGHEPD